MKDFNPFALGSTAPDGYKVVSASTTMHYKHTPNIEDVVESFREGVQNAVDTDEYITEKLPQILQSQADKYEREKGEMMHDIKKMLDISDLLKKNNDPIFWEDGIRT